MVYECFSGSFSGQSEKLEEIVLLFGAEETGKKSIDSWTMGFKLIAGFGGGGGNCAVFFLMETARKFFIRFVVVVRKICF